MQYDTAYMKKLTTKKQMQTWWALAGIRSKLRSKVKFFNFVPFSRLINFVCQVTANVKKLQKMREVVYNNSSNITNRKKLGPVGSVF